MISPLDQLGICKCLVWTRPGILDILIKTALFVPCPKFAPLLKHLGLQMGLHYLHTCNGTQDADVHWSQNYAYWWVSVSIVLEQQTHFLQMGFGIAAPRGASNCSKAPLKPRWDEGKIQADSRKFLDCFKIYLGSPISSQSLNVIHICQNPQQKVSFFIYFVFDCQFVSAHVALWRLT